MDIPQEEMTVMGTRHPRYVLRVVAQFADSSTNRQIATRIFEAVKEAGIPEGRGTIIKMEKIEITRAAWKNLASES